MGPESGQESKSTVLPPLDTRQAILNKEDGNGAITVGCFPNVSNRHGHFSCITLPLFQAGQQHITYIKKDDDTVAEAPARGIDLKQSASHREGVSRDDDQHQNHETSVDAGSRG